MQNGKMKRKMINKDIDICLTVNQALKVDNIIYQYSGLIRSICTEEYRKQLDIIKSKLYDILQQEPYNDSLYYIKFTQTEISLIFDILNKYKYMVHDIIPKPDVIYISDIMYDIRYQLVTEGEDI